ncbi:hypothetical protein Tco_0303040 [Tanacetum coccineum]
MSEAEPIPPTSSVTALRIPDDPEGLIMTYGPMKMRQYIAITDHILWDIITNGDQATTDPVSDGVSNSSSQNIAFLSTEIKGSTLKQSTADPENIPKGYTQAASSKVQTAPNCASHSDEIICSFFAQQASMPTTHDDEDLLQIDEDAMEEIDIRWQVAMITARIRKFMRKTGRPIDLKPKNRITFDKSKIECFNCQKFKLKSLGATTTIEDIDLDQEFDAAPVTITMRALTELKKMIGAIRLMHKPWHLTRWTV